MAVAQLGRRCSRSCRYEEDGFVQAQTPGSRDVLVFEKEPERAGHVGGLHTRGR